MSLAVVVGAVLAVLMWARRRHRRERSVLPTRRLRSGRRGALVTVVAILAAQTMLGAPVSAQGMNCKEAPNPERPGSGMVGALDPPSALQGQSGSPYGEFGYAGMVWHTYDLGCGPQGVTNPNALVDTWLGNEMFNIGKNIVGATNGLHYELFFGNMLEPLDGLIATGTVALYDSVFAPWFGLVAVALAILLFRYIWQGDLATIGKRSMWALAGLWFASATYLTPLVYTHALDDVVITGTSAVQAGFLREVGIDERDALPTLLHEQVIYQNWLRGEFGTEGSPDAKNFGRELLWAQAWTKDEMLGEAGGGSPDRKKQAFEDVAAKIENTSSYGSFQGVDGSRTGTGILAAVQGLAFASFQLLAKLAILLAQVLLRVLILAGPVIGLAALVYHEVLRTIGRVAGAAMLNVVVISAMAGVHTLTLTWIFAPASQLEVLPQILLAGLITIIFLMVGKPMRRMGQMIELSVGSVGGSMPRAPSSLFSRFRGRGQSSPDSPDDFWNQVRDTDTAGEGEGSGARRDKRSYRPEAEGLAVSATAQRLDQDGQRALSSAGSSSVQSDAGQPVLPRDGAMDQPRPGSRAAEGLPEARSTSRMVDTAPVAEAKWDNQEDDPVLVPSRTDRSMPTQVDAPSWRRADQEVVAGRPADVIYRPSRGLEVSNGD